MFNVGAQLRKTRKQSNLTLDQLAAASGVDRGTISRIELGHVSPRIDTIGFLCEAMNTNLSLFFGLGEGIGGDAQDGRPGPRDPGAGPAPALDDLKHGAPSGFPPEPSANPGMEGYWPVPSSFWKGLLEVLERFEILVKNSREMILVKDRLGCILYTSPPCEQILGLRPQDLVGRQAESLIHPDDRVRYHECLAAVSAQAGESRTLTYRMRHKDQSWCLISSKFSNHLGNPCICAVVVNSLLIPAL